MTGHDVAGTLASIITEQMARNQCALLVRLPFDYKMRIGNASKAGMAGGPQILLMFCGAA